MTSDDDSGVRSGAVLVFIRDALADLKKGQDRQGADLSSLFERVNAGTVEVEKLRSVMQTMVSKEEFQAHEESEHSRCLRLHGSSALDPTMRRKKTTVPTKKSGTWQAVQYALHTPFPYILIILVLVVIILVTTTGKPADHFIPHTGGGKP